MDKQILRRHFAMNHLINECKNLDYAMGQTNLSSITAGKFAGRLYKAILPQYASPNSDVVHNSLNILCVRIVFCLFADTSQIFKTQRIFYTYLSSFSAAEARVALTNLFTILSQKPADRNPYLLKKFPILANFPYVDGGLFAEKIIIPNFTPAILEIILTETLDTFCWKDISATIFSSVFESTLNPKTQRRGGMHYTSIDNIHKAIDPLFLNALYAKLTSILETPAAQTEALIAFRDMLATLKFLDPSCGSGNFLTQAYISLRKLENEVLKHLYETNAIAADATLCVIKVSISQFYGIEIDHTAVAVAKMAFWIAEIQMLQETEDIIKSKLEFFPLKNTPNIVLADALAINWKDVIAPDECSYIIGNPPFVGAKLQTPAQKAAVTKIFDPATKNLGNLDYVCGWFMKAANFIIGTKIECVFVATNSIAQGEAIPTLWSHLLQKNIKINFAYRSFAWKNNIDADSQAQVYCVIIGFATFDRQHKYLYHNGTSQIVSNINPYLLEGGNTIIFKTAKPICDVSTMLYGSQPNDGGFLSKYSAAEVAAIVANYPSAKALFRPFVGSTEFINNKKRFCLWLDGVPPATYAKISPIMNAIQNVKAYRKSSSALATQNFAETPYLFAGIRQPLSNYLLIPRTSSGNRSYIPIGYLSSNIIASDSVFTVPNATLYEFGVITSSAHMNWMRTICGRLKNDYRYSNTLIYNTFPWCTPTPSQRKQIETTAAAILAARDAFPEASLAELYNDLTMPEALLNAHQANDAAVYAAYGLVNDTSNCVTHLLNLYSSKI